MAKRLKAPDGTELLGVVQNIVGYSECDSVDDDGDPIYEGGTEIDWNDMTEATLINKETKAMERVWLDGNGKEWLESQLIAEEIVEDGDTGEGC